jgi:hypothetical protein
MLSRNWLLHPPVGVGLAIVLMFVAAGLINQHRYGSSADYPSGQEFQIAQEAASGVAAHAPPANPNPERGEWRDERDLEAQQDMAKWAMFLFVATLVGLGLLAATLLETREAARAAWEMVEESKQATAAAKATLTLETRPYIVLDSFSYQQGIREYAAKFSFKNVGRTPADITRICGTLVYLVPDEAVNPEDQRFQILADFGEPIILPADQVVPDTTLHFDESELLRGIDTARKERQPMGSVVGIIRIEYQAVIGDSKELRYTQCGYHFEFAWNTFPLMYRSTPLRSLTNMT